MFGERTSCPGILGRPVRFLLLLLALGSSACGNLTAGGATGEATVYVTGDAADPQPTSPSPSGSDGSGDEPEGELELRFGLALVTDGGSTVPLTEDEVRVRVEFPGDQEVRAVSRAVPTGRYSALRVVFTRIEAEVDAGLVVDGVEIRGPVEVELEADSLVVQRPLSLVLEEDEDAELLVDMNASAWLQAVDPDLRVVAGAVVSDALRVIRR